MVVHTVCFAEKNCQAMADLIGGDKVKCFLDAFNSLASKEGILPTKQLRSLLMSVGENPTPEELQEMVDVVDKGNKGTVKFPDFLQMMATKVDLKLITTDNFAVKVDGDARDDDIREAFGIFDNVRGIIFSQKID